MPVDAQTLVVGASAAGLATAACLRSTGQQFEILEATSLVGNTWRHHYDRLHLHTPKSSSSLPGLHMPARWPRYPSRDQVVEYLEHFRDHHRLSPHYGQQVSRLEWRDGQWIATTADREWRSANVVVATGRTRCPVRPSWPGLAEFNGQILHSDDYRNGEKWRGRPVLVVGFGNSACEQAVDLVEHGAAVHLSVRSPVNVIPRDILGVIPVLQLAILMRHLPAAVADSLASPMIRFTVGDIRKIGLHKLPYGPITQIIRDQHIPLLDIGTIAHIKAGRIGIHGDIARFGSSGVIFQDGSALDVDAVVTGTGYRPGLQEFLPDWRAVCDADGIPEVSGAPTALPGLFFCGQYVSPAGMLREIGIEARRIANYLRLAGPAQ